MLIIFINYNYSLTNTTFWGFRVTHYEMHNPTKCIIFSLIISPLLPALTMTTSTKAYRMQLALVELVGIRRWQAIRDVLGAELTTLQGG